MATDARIRQAAEALARVFPDATTNQRVILLSHALQEAQFGDAFATPDKSSAYNWGAIYTKGDRGTLPRVDYDPGGKQIKVGAAWNSSDDVGAKQLLDLLRSADPEALPAAASGSWWAYSHALWRDGPSYPGHSSKRPSWYVGFPPGHPYGVTPASVPLYSATDFHLRQTAYAKFLRGAGAQVQRAIGATATLDATDPPPPPVEPPAAPPASVSSAAATPVAAGLILYALWRFFR